MLKGIPKILSPELLKVLCEMGHSDTLVIGDGNFPAESKGKNAVAVSYTHLAVLKCNNLELDVETSLPLKEEDFEKNTLVLAMTKEQKEKIYENFPSAQNVYTLKEFAGESGDVINPYGEPLTGYGACYEELNRLIDVYKRQPILLPIITR